MEIAPILRWPEKCLFKWPNSMMESIISLAMGLLIAAFAMFVIDNYLSAKRELSYLMHAAVIVALGAWLLQIAGIAWPAFSLFARVILTSAVFGLAMWTINGQAPRRQSVKAVLNAGVLVVASLFLLRIFSV